MAGDYRIELSLLQRVHSKTELGDLLIPLRYVSPPRPMFVHGKKEGAEGQLAMMFDDMLMQLGTVPPPEIVLAYHPGLLTAWWILGRWSLIVPGDLARAKKETLVAQLARANGAHLLESLHTLWLEAIGQENVGCFLRGEKPFAQLPEQFQEVVLLGQALHSTEPCQHIRTVPAECFVSARAKAELIAATLAFDLLSRITAFFVVTESLEEAAIGPNAGPLARAIYKYPLHALIKASTTRAFKRIDHRKIPGLRSFEEAGIYGSLPDRFAWARAHSFLAEGLGYLQHEVNCLERWIDPVVRDAIHAKMGRVTAGPNWNEAQRAELEIARITICSPRRISDEVIVRYHATHPGAGESGLVALVTWVAFYAAAEISDRLLGMMGSIAPSLTWND